MDEPNKDIKKLILEIQLDFKYNLLWNLSSRLENDLMKIVSKNNSHMAFVLSLMFWTFVLGEIIYLYKCKNIIIDCSGGATHILSKYTLYNTYDWHKQIDTFGTFPIWLINLTLTTFLFDFNFDDFLFPPFIFRGSLKTFVHTVHLLQKQTDLGYLPVADVLYR